jgi:hypothetical protein
MAKKRQNRGRKRSVLNGWLMCLGVFLGFVAFADSGLGLGNKRSYEVVSVYRGAVQMIETSTGKPINVYDENLVEMALEGKIKKGDIITLGRGQK